MTTDGTKARLVEAAWTCVRASGLRGATSRAITDAAGANLGAINYHFGTKEELVAAAIVTRVRHWLAPALASLRRDDLDPTGRVLTAISDLNRAVTDMGDEAGAFVEALAASRHLPPLADELRALLAELRGELAAQMRGNTALPSWVEPHAFAGLLLSLGTGLAVTTAVDPDMPALDAMSLQFARLLLTVPGDSVDPGA